MNKNTTELSPSCDLSFTSLKDADDILLKITGEKGTHLFISEEDYLYCRNIYKEHEFIKMFEGIELEFMDIHDGRWILKNDGHEIYSDGA